MFPMYKISGKPFERGYQIGYKTKNQIRYTINVYERIFKDCTNLSWNEASSKVKDFIPYIEDFDHEIIEEIRGIAAGSGLREEDIITLNARSEMIFTKQMLDGCTSFALEPGVTTSGTTFIGQNWDWKRELKESIVILEIVQEGKPNVVMVTEAGIIGKIGFNSAGIGVCLNALATDKVKPGLPFHIVLRGMLNSENLGDSIEVVSHIPIAGAGNCMIGDAKGEIIDIEITPEDFDILYPSKGILVHTNHFLSQRLFVHDIGKRIFSDTFIRYHRMIKLLKDKFGKIDLKFIKKVLQDHYNYPNSICRHEDLRKDQKERLCTVISVIMDLRKKNLWITSGPPCENDYIRLFFKI
ncbi:MAG: C45 family peptidase [Candidatus Bathyarchaeia archaeon]